LKRKFPTSSQTFDPEALRLIDAYAEKRGIKRATTVSELILYLIKGTECETNPEMVKQTISAIRESEGTRGFA
jgi:hypothetical protein